ncbi:MAG: PaaI family thioesterase [Gammaproteobacteria bacterium]
MDEPQAFQDQITGNHCFGCGPRNAGGLQIKSYWSGQDKTTVRFEPQQHQCAGPADLVNGGIIATVIDCHCVCTAMAHAYRLADRPMGSEPKLWFVTGSLQVSYQAPTPIDRPFDVNAEIADWSDRKTIVRCELVSGDLVCATGEVIAVRVPESLYE